MQCDRQNDVAKCPGIVLILNSNGPNKPITYHIIRLSEGLKRVSCVLKPGCVCDKGCRKAHPTLDFRRYRGSHTDVRGTRR